jgi:hypothetical protein
LIRSISRQNSPALRLTSQDDCHECHLHSLNVHRTPLPLPMATTVSISHKGGTYAVQVDPKSRVSSFRAQLEELTSVPVANQKLRFKGRKVSAKDDDTLGVFGLKCGTMVQMLGSTVEEIGGLRAVEDEKKRTEQILRNRETQTKVRQVTFPSVERRLTDNVSHRRTLPRTDPKRPLPNSATVSTISNLWGVSQTRRGPVGAHQIRERRRDPCVRAHVYSLPLLLLLSPRMAARMQIQISGCSWRVSTGLNLPSWKLKV